MNISSSQIELLVLLVEKGSFSEAAQEMGLTQSAVSHALARLESELGVVLVERGRRGVVLTEAGQSILPHAREVRTRLQTIRETAQAVAGNHQGRLRFATIPAFPSASLPVILNTYQQKYPAVEVALLHGSEADVLQWIADGVADVGVVPHPAKDCESRPLKVEPFVAVVPSMHVFAQRPTVSRAELYPMPLILPAWAREAISGLMRRPEGFTERSAVRHLVSDVSTVLALTIAEIGVGIVPQSALPLRDEPMPFHAVSLEPEILLSLGLGVRSWNALSPIVSTFIEQILEAEKS